LTVRDLFTVALTDRVSGIPAAEEIVADIRAGVFGSGCRIWRDARVEISFATPLRSSSRFHGAGQL
jgi:hypothetical protein